MEMRIKEEDLQAHVTNVLMALKHGVEAARAQGLIAELPEKVDFEVSVITEAQSLNSVTVSNDSETSDGTETKGTGTMVRTEGGVTEVQVRAAREILVTEAGTTTQGANINSSTGGGDHTQTDYTY